MTSNTEFLSRVLLNLKVFREEAGYDQLTAEKALILGAGWIDAIEMGRIIPTMDVIASLLSLYKKTLADLAVGATGGTSKIYRSIYAEQVGSDLDIKFAYAKYDASYRLSNATITQFNQVLGEMRDGLSKLIQIEGDETVGQALKTDSVANSFLKAVELWPLINPSDIWWFIVSRAYCDPYNHPAQFSRLDFSQSWKRTGGWALERILEKHYAPSLRKHGINLFIADGEKKQQLLDKVTVAHRLEADKMDVLLTVGSGESEALIGVVHVKASFAERRTDDVPMSHALVQAGYISPLWTMDCKSSPSAHPVNKGELGDVYAGTGTDSRSAKRKDIEDDRFFSACFSYNSRTKPTPSTYARAKAKVYVCDFSNPEDTFVEYIVSERKRIKKALGI